MNEAGRTARGRLAAVGILLTCGWLSGCATVPPESVELSRQVGAGIAKAHSAHLSTLDAFYARMNADNDAWVVNTFVPQLIATTTSTLAAACREAGDHSSTCSQLDNDDIQRIIIRSIEFRDDVHRALAKNRDDAARLINEHYADLLAANAGVTALLASAVDVSKATRESAATVGRAAGINIDTDAIQEAVSGFLEKAGSAGTKISDLKDQLSEIVNRPDE